MENEIRKLKGISFFSRVYKYHESMPRMSAADLGKQWFYISTQASWGAVVPLCVRLQVAKLGKVPAVYLPTFLAALKTLQNTGNKRASVIRPTYPTTEAMTLRFNSPGIRS